MPRQITCVDPLALESKIVIDATEHDAFVAKKLEEKGLIKTKGHLPRAYSYGNCSFYSLWTSKNETNLGGMILSGKRVAEVALEKLKELE